MNKTAEQIENVRRAIERTYQPGRDYGAACCDAINETKKLLALIEAAPQPQAEAVAHGLTILAAMLTEEEMEALRSFAYQVEETETYSVPKELMIQLVMRGAVYPAKRPGWYYLTDFGRTLLSAREKPAAPQPQAEPVGGWEQLREHLTEVLETASRVDHAGYCRVWLYGADEIRCECNAHELRTDAKRLLEAINDIATPQPRPQAEPVASDDIGAHFAKMREKNELESARRLVSRSIAAMLDVKVMIEDGDYDEAIQHIEALTEGVAPQPQPQASASRDDLTAIVKALRPMLPSNLCITNPNVSDATEIPITATMGELREVARAAALAEAILTAPQPQAEPVGEWVMVPREPTQEMMEVGYKEYGSFEYMPRAKAVQGWGARANAIYRAMLAAAPQPQGMQ